ncbi:MAG: 4Fe-4S dicluster domain-containing protein [Candidatus Woesearchaeota archaeon]
MGKYLKKEDFNKFILNLKSRGELWAPVQRDTLRFENIDNINEIVLKGNPWFPPKKLLFPKSESIFKYKDGKIVETNDKIKEQIIFGLRLCDLNAIKIIDKLFNDEFVLPSYKKRRENTILVGIHCHFPQNEYCFCETMELTKYYDLYLIELNDGYFVDVGTDKGKKIISGLKDYDYEIPTIKTDKKLDHKNYEEIYVHNNWDLLSKKCLNCGQCTTLCPTCTCFDVIDNINLDLKTGSRDIVYDGCQFKEFTRVAGGHVFRETRTQRLKHRIYHKLKYFKDKFGIYMCTGCGRCIRACPTKVDFVELINNI